MRLNNDLGVAVDVGTDSADLNTDPVDASAKATVIPLGNINGKPGVDEYADYIAAVHDTVGTWDDYLATPAPLHPQEFVGASYATVVFGSTDGGTVVPGARNSFTLKLPAPVLTTSFGTQAKFASGDFNGDRVNDIAVLISSVDSAGGETAGRDPYSLAGVYVLFGRSTWPSEVDLLADADAVITGFEQPYSIAAVGDMNADGFDELAVGQDGRPRTESFCLPAERMSGRLRGRCFTVISRAAIAAGSRWTTASVLPSTACGTFRPADPTTRHTAERAASITAPAKGRTATGLMMSGSSAGTITSEVFTVPAAMDLANFELSFRTFLQTERSGNHGSDNFDIPTVRVSTDGGASFTTVASNLDLLTDTTDGLWRQVTIPMENLRAGDKVCLQFSFDTKDANFNDYEGWYVDDVYFRATVDARRIAARAYEGARDVAAIGDITGDGRSDLAAFVPSSVVTHNDTLVYILRGGPSLPASGVLSGGEYPVLKLGYLGPTVSVAAIGNLNGDGRGDFVVRSNLGGNVLTSILVFGSSTGAYSAYKISGKWVIPLGDINGDGLADLAAPIRKTFDSLAEDGTTVSQRAFEVFFNVEGKDWRPTSAFDDPDMIIEPNQPQHADTTTFILRTDGFSSLGDVNGDGGNDFGIADTFGGQTHAYFGRRLQPPVVPTDGQLTPSPFAYELAKPIVSNSTSRPGMDLNDSASPDVRDAFGLQGNASDEELYGSESIGDFNGDGLDDLLVWSNTTAYLLLGPVTLSDMSDVAIRSSCRIDLTDLGIVQRGSGDVDGDGLADLLFVRHDSGDYVVSALFGRFDPPRDLSATDAQELLHLSGSGLAATETPQVQLLNWDGDSRADVLVMLPTASSTTDIYGSLFRGIDLNPTSTLYANYDQAYAWFGRGTDSATQILTELFGSTTGYSITAGGTDAVFAATDFDGDGRDDLVVGLPAAFSISYAGQPLGELGRVHVLPGGTSGAIWIGESDGAAVLAQDFDLAAGVFAVGDINRDGFQDVAVTSASENGDPAGGSVFIYYGSSDLGALAPERASAADIVIRRMPAETLSQDTYVTGPIQISVGDYDASGMLDLAIGQPYRTVTDGANVYDVQDRGSVHVIWDVAELGGRVTLTDGPVDLDGDGLIDVTAILGQTNGDRFGYLPGSARLNLTGGRYDDLLIGAPLADVPGGTVRTDAGRIYATYGSPRRLDLSAISSQLISNHTISGLGNVLYKSGDGQMERFADDPAGGTSDYVLADSEDVNWYRFATIGDGVAGDAIRVVTGAYVDRAVTLDGPAGYVTGEFGEVDDTSDTILIGSSAGDQGVFEMDLSGLGEQLADPTTIDKVELVLSASVRADLPLHYPTSLTAGTTDVYFFDYDAGDWYLWKTDGTVAGTVQVSDTAFSNINDQMVTSSNRLFFIGTGDTTGQQLWTTDGTAAGTVRITSITGTPGFDHLTAFRGRVYFDAVAGTKGRQLYETIGSSGVYTASPKTNVSGGIVVSNIVADKNHLYYSTFEGTTTIIGRGSFDEYDLWHIDRYFLNPANIGTAVMPAGEEDGLLVESAFMDSELYFAGYYFDTTWHTRIYKISGATVTGLGNANAGWSGPRAFAGVDGLMFFVTYDNKQIWETSSTAGNVQQIDYPDLFETFTNDNYTPRAISCNGMVFLTVEGRDAGLPLGAKALSITVGAGNHGVVTEIASGAVHIGGLTSLGDTAVFELNDHLYVSDSTGRSLHELYMNSGLGDVVTLGSQAIFSGRLPGSTTDRTIWTADSDSALPVTAQPGSTGTLTVELLDEEGDGVITPRDGSAAGTVAASTTVGALYDTVQTITLDVTDAVLAAIGRGDSSLTLRVSVDPSLFVEAYRLDPQTGEGSAVRVTRQPGVVMDVFDANGGMLYEGLNAVDMRAMAAGTYYLRVRNPLGEQNGPLPFAIEVDPPQAGWAWTATDNDLIHGGDGEDAIVGNGGLDRLFGDSGDDAFRAEAVEVRDLENSEKLTPPDAAERIVNSSVPAVDPLVNGAVNDPVLVAALAAALDVPAVPAPGGGLDFGVPVHASDLGTIVRLDLSNLGLTDLTGIEYATNLLSLNVSGNSLHGLLGPLEPGVAEVGRPGAGSRVGLARLNYLMIDSAGLDDADLMSIELLSELRLLTAAGNNLTSTDALHLMTHMTWLDLSANELNSVAGLGAMTDLQVARLADNHLVDIGPLAGASIIDEGDWDGGYGESDRWFASQHSVERYLPERLPLHGSRTGQDRVVVLHRSAGRPVRGVRDLARSPGPGHRCNVRRALSRRFRLGRAGQPAFRPDDATFAGLIFESLGTFTPDEGNLTIDLSALNADGTVTADAVLIVSAEGSSTALGRLELHGNPLSNYSRDVYIPLLEQQSEASLSVDVDPDTASPSLPGQLDPQSSQSDEPQILLAQGLDSMAYDTGWTLMVAAGGSAEVLRFNSYYGSQPNAFAGVGVSTKLPGQTGQSIAVGGVFTDNGAMYLVDAAAGRILRRRSDHGRMAGPGRPALQPAQCRT